MKRVSALTLATLMALALGASASAQTPPKPPPGHKPMPQLIGWLDHQGEHYGKLVTSYRVNGVVPPVSRPKS